MAYSEIQLRQAILTSTSRREVLQKLGLVPAGGNYQSLNRAIKKWHIDTSHLIGQAWSRHQALGSKRSLNDYLSNQQTIQSYKLKRRLLLEGIFPHQCSNCQRTEWLDQPIPLELDHINGNSQDNSLSNLRMLCPNCHALTPTYRGKNKKRVAPPGVEPGRSLRAADFKSAPSANSGMEPLIE
jgi:5-methylcytosine-specific restriction endonuclease McrA